MGNNEWLDIDVLDDYLEGKLEASMMHKVERISLEDPFVAQALAGLSEAKKRTQALSFLQKQLQERVAEKPVERKMWRMASHRLSIAATAAVLFLTVSVLFWMRENHRQQQAELAKSKAKNIEVDLKSEEIIAAAPIDTVIAKKAETAIDQQKLEQALNQTLAKGNQAIVKNNYPKEIVTTESPALAHREVERSRLKKEVNENQAKMVGAQIATPAPPVQTLESRVEGIQVKTDLYAKSVKGTVYDVYGRPLSGVDVKMVGDDLRSITNKSGEFALPINKDSNKVTLEVASLGFAKKNVEARPNENINIRLEGGNNALNEVVVASAAEAKYKGTVSTKAIDSPIIFADRIAGVGGVVPVQGWKSYEDYLKGNNKLLRDGNKIVHLSFMVKKDGSITNIKLVKGQTQEMNNEAIRLLKQGPKWKYNLTGANQGSIYIKF